MNCKLPKPTIKEEKRRKIDLFILGMIQNERGAVMVASDGEEGNDVGGGVVVFK